MLNNQSSSLIDTALQQIKRTIICCELPPGEKLKVAELSKLYGLSSSPIREALNRLTQEGIVTASEKRGFRVAAMSVEDFREITRLRCLLESEALADAIEYGDDGWEANILGAFHRLSVIEKKLGKTSVALDDDWAARHKAFHFAIFSACPSPLLMGMIDSLFDRAERYRRFSARNRVTKRSKEGEHRQLMTAALARDTEQAQHLLKRHINGTLGNVAEALERQQATLQ